MIHRLIITVMGRVTSVMNTVKRAILRAGKPALDMGADGRGDGRT